MTTKRLMKLGIIAGLLLPAVSFAESYLGACLDTQNSSCDEYWSEVPADGVTLQKLCIKKDRLWVTQCPGVAYCESSGFYRTVFYSSESDLTAELKFCRAINGLPLK